MPDASLAAPLLLAAVLVVAGLAKWNNRDSLASAVRQLRLPPWVQGPAAWLPPIELALGAGLLLAPVSALFSLFALLTTGLMAAYAVVVWRGLGLTPRPSCGCFGVVGAPITPATLVRNLVFTALGVVALAWGLTGHTAITSLAAGGAPAFAWLVALLATAAVTYWIAADRRGMAEDPSLTRTTLAAEPPLATAVPSLTESAPDEVDLADYVREPIPGAVLLEADGTPVTLAQLATGKAALVIWVTCGCARSTTALDRGKAIADEFPVISVRYVSAMDAEFTAVMFPDRHDFLFDPFGVALGNMGLVSDPVAVLLGADGLLAGGPVAGSEAVRELCEGITEQLREARLESPVSEPN